MSGLLDMEAPNRGTLRSSLVAGFNDAYTTTSAAFLSCDNRAISAESKFAAQGQSLANALAMHYFPTDTTPRTPD
jgi:predicted secreted protein